jgi:tRNA1(Val) A37 N6-methylase TrmN6
METTTDAFLGGKVQLTQPAQGYRAGIDAVLLAAAVRAERHQRVCEFGCGSGAVLLCLNARVMGISGVGVEPDADLRALAEANIETNAAPFGIINATVQNFETEPNQFDHVFFNPPYYEVDTFNASPHDTRNAAHALTAPIADWFKAARRVLKHEGQVTVILPPAMLADVLAGMNGFGAVEIIPIRPHADKPAKRLIIRGIMGRKTPLELRPDVVLHKADNSYTDVVERVLRYGIAL